MRQFGRWTGPAAALVVAGATMAAPDGAAARDRETGGKSVSAAVVRAHTQFACDLYGKLRTERGNVVFSPHSVSTALWMTSEGARKDTFVEMWRVLHRSKSLDSDSHAALVTDLAPREIDGQPTYSLSVANAVWGSDRISFLGPFSEVLATQYGAPVQRVDFTQTSAARKRINGWVSENTAGKIEDIVPEGSPPRDTRLVLANAIHFKASWWKAFQERWTKDAPFRTAAGDEVTVPLMHRRGDMPHGRTDAARFVDLGLAGHDTALTIVLPTEGHTLADVEAQLRGPETLDAWFGAMENKNVDLRLPRFSVASGFELSSALQELGMKRPFLPNGADFTGITTDEPLFIGLVAHRATMDVDEAGVEAAAATVVMMRTGARPPDQTTDFRVDQPFLFVLRHTGTGEILFMGRVDDPTAD